MKRWVVLALGLGIGLVAAYAVLTTRPPQAVRAPAPDSISGRGAADFGSASPSGEIREPSKARLREILRRAERDEEDSP